MRLALLPLALLLSACGAVTLPGLRAAGSLDPLGTPPEAIAVAISLPAELRLRDGDATVRLALEGDDGPLVDETVPLALVDAPGPDGSALGDRVVVARFGPAAAARFAAAQAEIRRLRAAGTEGRGSLSVAVRGGCLTGPLGDTLPVATWLRPAPDADFLPLTRRGDLLAALEPEDRDALLAGLPPC
ncbi:MAG: hypothetical protein AAF390_19955 [Pseudomonadota bacterium]